jgi:hypothetical protein
MRRRDSKKLFSIINKIVGKRSGKTIGIEPVRNLQGKIISEKQEVLNRWKEHYENLLNRDDPADKDRTIEEIRASVENLSENLDEGNNDVAGEVTVDEVVKAINQLRRNKAPGICNIPTELLRDRGEAQKCGCTG